MNAVTRSAQDEACRAAVARAQRAPSEHNAQPWHWRLGDHGVDLSLDPGRRLLFTDDGGHGELLGCGCALHHLRLALLVDGWHADVRHGSDRDPDHPLARVRVRPGAEPDRRSRRQAAAMTERHTDRRRFSHDPVAADDVDALVDAARPFGAVAHLAIGTVRRLVVDAAHEAGEAQRHREGYASELQRWTHRPARSRDGIPASVRLGDPSTTYRDLPMRWLPPGMLRQPRGGLDHEDASMLLILSASADDPVSLVRAGESLSAVLLEATARGLATTPLATPFEDVTTRRRVRELAVGAHRVPVIAVRVGRPLPDATPLPPTPRRELDLVLDPRPVRDPGPADERDPDPTEPLR